MLWAPSGNSCEGKNPFPHAGRTGEHSDAAAWLHSPEDLALQYIDPSLPRELFGWHSHRLGMHMPIVRYGYRGHPLLLFPTAQADYLENERFFLIKSVEPLLFAGKVQIFSIDSINRHAWMNRSVSVPEAARRQSIYSQYIEEEVVPHIRRVMNNPSARIWTSGASFGAFYAVNALFRRPDLFDGTIAMSGFYDLSAYYEGYSDERCYFNNPAWYVKEINDPGVLHTLRHQTQIHIVTGQGAFERPSASQRFSQILWDKGIPNNLDVWGHDVDHDWPWWRRMLPHYLGHVMRY